MSSTSEIMAIAKQMHSRFGHHAERVVSQRADENRAVGDVEAAELWGRVAAFIRATKTSHERSLALSKPFRPAFQATPHAYLLLSPKLFIMGANDAYLSATMARRSDLVGCEMFDAFPENPADQKADGAKNLKASLARVLDKGCPDIMECQRYDVPRRDGAFEERWWMPQNIPVFDESGRLISVLHHVEDVTASRRH